MNLLPESFRPKKDPERTFVYPPAAEANDAITVTLRYQSPMRMATIQDQLTARFSRDLEKAPGVPRGEQSRKIATELISSAVVRCEGATFKKLSALVPLEPEIVAQNGGLDEVVPMDPSGPSAHIAEAWIKYLIESSTPFANWASITSQDISKFQSEDWAGRAKNLKVGPVITGPSSLGTDQESASPA